MLGAKPKDTHQTNLHKTSYRNIIPNLPQLVKIDRFEINQWVNIPPRDLSFIRLKGSESESNVMNICGDVSCPLELPWRILQEVDWKVVEPLSLPLRTLNSNV